MTNPFNARFDSTQHSRFLTAGLADYAIYTPADRTQASVTCRVLVDRAMESTGFDSQAWSPAVTIRVLLADIGAPPRIGALFAIGDERYVVDREPDRDESLATCLVSREVQS